MNWNEGSISFYTNDGTNTFTLSQLVEEGKTTPRSPYFADLDRDGDLDFVVGFADEIAWYENLGGQFSEKNSIGKAGSASSVSAVDIDNDGDLDVLSTSIDDEEVRWYENDGTTNFSTEHIIIQDVVVPRVARAVDVDMDGDLDVLVGKREPNAILCLKNDGTGNFTEESLVSEDVDAPTALNLADLDMDGDLDLLSASLLGDKIDWHIADGSGAFPQQQTISETLIGAIAIDIADLDGDNDLDLLAVGFGDNKISWYENRLMTTSTATVAPMAAVQVYPNPFDEQLTFESSKTQAYTLELTNSMGQQLKSMLLDKEVYQLQTYDLPAGVYFYSIRTPLGELIDKGKLIRQ